MLQDIEQVKKPLKRTSADLHQELDGNVRHECALESAYL